MLSPGGSPFREARDDRPSGSSAGRAVARDLGTTSFGNLGSICLNVDVNRVHHVTTINRVAEELGEDEHWFGDIAIEMETEDGCIWVSGIGEDGALAFTGFGIENCKALVAMHKADAKLIKRLRPQ